MVSSNHRDSTCDGMTTCHRLWGWGLSDGTALTPPSSMGHEVMEQRTFMSLSCLHLVLLGHDVERALVSHGGFGKAVWRLGRQE